MKSARWLVGLPLVAGCVIAGALVVPPVSSAGTPPPAVVRSVYATPSQLAAGGGLVRVTASVHGKDLDGGDIRRDLQGIRDKLRQAG